MKKILICLLFLSYFIKAQEDFIVIALGESCGVTAALEVFKLKKASYPFEWCISNFEHLYNSLKNDFADFTNPDYFTLYFNKQGPVNKYGIVLAHDFPVVPDGLDENGKEKHILDPEWQKYLPAVQTKYQRRIDRFHAACNSGKKVYFVRHLEITEPNARRLSELLCQLYPHLDFTLICVRLQPPHLGIWNVPRVKNYYIDTTAPWGDVEEWRRIFVDVGVIPATRSANLEKLAKTYRDKLCGDCSYCQNLKDREK